ncbi:MAG: N-6 DNA methylase, partial [Acidimicrobiia bacterium]|nr:N-6 DNA methylase [Acidimicrobiia bacterium]
MPPTEEEVRRSFGEGPRLEMELAGLERLYRQEREHPTVAVKRELWRQLLTAALGVAVDEEGDLDRQFIRHTYLSVVVGTAVQAAFGIDVRKQVVLDPSRLLTGDAFFAATGIRGVIESDFFAWPAEVGGERWLTDIAGRVSRFDWRDTEHDIARILYQSVVPAEDRRRLGEYYTPHWLAQMIVDAAVTDPLRQRVLDPACGAGTFLHAAIRKYVGAARAAGHPPRRILSGLQNSVTGVDVHPVAVHLARATWTLAARDVITEVDRGAEDLTIPVYLGDSLQLRTDDSSLFGSGLVTIDVEDGTGTATSRRRLEFPRALVEQADWFDRVMLGVSEAIEGGYDPRTALDDAGIDPGHERHILEATVSRLVALHEEGRNHVWAYYTRNLVRPVWLSSPDGQVDVIVGNPPWLTYNRVDATLRSELERQSKEIYGIWVGRHFATQQDIAGLFYTRCVDLYLRDGGVAAMVLPHSALQAGQYQKWRSGSWQQTRADLAEVVPWDLERIEPNTFFPVPACVAFARKVGDEAPRKLGNEARRLCGRAGGPFTDKVIPLTDTGGDELVSPYGERARNGATVFPRPLFFVHVSESTTAIAGGIVSVSPWRSAHEHKPWRELPLEELVDGHIEESHVWDVQLGATVAPYVLLEPRQAVLPVRRGGGRVAYSTSDDAICGVDPTSLDHRMRGRWRAVSELWEAHKGANNQLDLLQRLDYMRNLSIQLSSPVESRLLYTSSGRPTAAVLTDPDPLAENSLYCVACETVQEAHFLAAVINSRTLENAVKRLMPKGQFGARHLHRHLWRLPIPTYDATDELHVELASLGGSAAIEAAARHEELQAVRAAASKPTSVTVVRRELRLWLETSPIGNR